MKLYSLLVVCFLFTVSGFSQKDLKKFVLNKDKTIPSDWVHQIQNTGKWEYLKTVAVKRKKVKDHYLGENGKSWDFKSSTVSISPYHWKIDRTKYSEFDVKYYSANQTIVLRTTLVSGDQKIQRTIVFKVINLISDYLILEEIDNTYCFDFVAGKILSKKECKAKGKNEPERLFGGRSISIGGKPSKLRLVFKLKKNYN